MNRAKELAELVLSIPTLSPVGRYAKELARNVLDITAPDIPNGEIIAITTNGTTRFIPRDEPVFLLRGQDRFGGSAVRHWAKRAAAAGADMHKIDMAIHHARAMEAWPVKKIPD